MHRNDIVDSNILLMRFFTRLAIRLYLSFTLRILIAFGIIFQVPIVTIFLIRWNIIQHQTLRNGSEYVIVFSFVAAIITPRTS